MRALLDAIRVARPAGSLGRPCKRPGRLLADRGYAHDSYQPLSRRRATLLWSPSGATRRSGGLRRGGRPPLFDAEAYRERNVVERCCSCRCARPGSSKRYKETIKVIDLLYGRTGLGPVGRYGV